MTVVIFMFHHCSISLQKFNLVCYLKTWTKETPYCKVDFQNLFLFLPSSHNTIHTNVHCTVNQGWQVEDVCFSHWAVQGWSTCIILGHWPMQIQNGKIILNDNRKVGWNCSEEKSKTWKNSFFIYFHVHLLKKKALSCGWICPHMLHAFCPALYFVSGSLNAHIPSVGEKCILNSNIISFDFSYYLEVTFHPSLYVTQFQFQYLPKILTYSLSIWPWQYHRLLVS